MNRWLDRLSTWQYVAVMVGLCVLAFTIEAFLFTLAYGHVNLTSLIRFACTFTFIFTGVSAWGRWRNRHVRR